MNVLLINPNFDPKMQSYSRMSGMPLGILSIATYLNKNGHRAAVVDRFLDHTPLDVLFERYKPDIIGIALIGNVTIHDMVEIGNYFHKKGVKVAVGGPHASIIPELILQDGCADYVVIGEGEQTWLELTEALERSDSVGDVKGIAYLSDTNETVFTEERPFMDLSLLGPTDFSLLPHPENYFQTSYCYEKMLYLYHSKGCTGNCTFCFNSFFHRCKRRVRPVNDLLDEIEYLMDSAGMKTVYFSDELWGVYKDEREAFFQELEKRKLSLIWGCQTRIGVLKKDDLQKMYDHGCRWIMFGVEAPPGRLAEFTNKKLPYKLLPETLLYCKEIGIITNISFIINYPHETEQDLKDTVQYALSLSPTFYSIHFFYPLEKSVLYDLVVRENLFIPPKTLNEAADTLRSEQVISTFSEVKDIDYKVIRSCFLLQALLTKTPGKQEDASFVKEAAKSVFINLKGLNPGEWLVGLWQTGTYFLSTVSQVVCHPLIRKRYGFRFKFKS